MPTLIYALEFVVCVLFVLLFVQIYRGYRSHVLQAERIAAEQAAAAAALISARARQSVLSQRGSKAGAVKAEVLTESASTQPEKPLPEKASAETVRLVVPVLEPLLAGGRERESVVKPSSTQAFAKFNAANNDAIADAKKSESILNDYIDGFFFEPVKADIKAFRAAPVEREVASVVSAKKPGDSRVAEAAKKDGMKDTAKDGMHLVGSEVAPMVLAAAVAVLDAETASGHMAEPVDEMALQDDLEDDLIITVTAESGVEREDDRVMSDKVVHAMLDEAKLICAS